MSSIEYVKTNKGKLTNKTKLTNFYNQNPDKVFKYRRGDEEVHFVTNNNDTKHRFIFYNNYECLDIYYRCKEGYRVRISAAGILEIRIVDYYERKYMVITHTIPELNQLFIFMKPEFSIMNPFWSQDIPMA